MLANESKSSIESKLAVRNSKTPLLGTAKTVSKIGTLPGAVPLIQLFLLLKPQGFHQMC